MVVRTPVRSETGFHITGRTSPLRKGSAPACGLRCLSFPWMAGIGAAFGRPKAAPILHITQFYGALGSRGRSAKAISARAEPALALLSQAFWMANCIRHA